MPESLREEDYVPISALQHYIFCPRQCALIHTEQEWKENTLTTLGRMEHKRVDTAPGNTRGGIYTARGCYLVCRRLGIRGRADAIEYRSRGGDIIGPVEYKHGRPKEHDADAVQLCAQALCLEEMHGCRIEQAFLYYHATRHRQTITLTPTLRRKTEETIAAVQALLQSRSLPPAHYRTECRACSLLPICLPRHPSAGAYNNDSFEAALCDV